MNSFGKERDGLLAAHPTPKPVALIADALRDVSKRGEYVVDPFLGSGSTLMAAEATGRICVGNELDSAYVDVAIRRWQKATGQAAIHVQTGQSFDAIAQAIAETALIEALASNNTMTPPMATGVAGVAKGEPPETAALAVACSITHVADTLTSSDLRSPDQPVASSTPLIGAAAPDGDLDVFEVAGDDTQVRHD
ncbi:prophage LambdaW4, DNA methylase [Nitrobacter sp. Nb-311A]|uniref:DNA methyltransferase n=1 Tax=Nitrobacter sp. Nb-311A TaxID=314253 RepID=UPI0000684AD6|nr:DNA methyltransferase [Nitrobacter sp. Nb-311A]EAQ33374.1 prophage LambdaW4, DNA methylase [Nitrobacter sp. Nb-311A]